MPAFASSRELSLELAHRCMSWALQFDYLSNGAGHCQTTVPPRDARLGPLGRATAGVVQRRDIARQYFAEIARRRRLSSSEEYSLATAAVRGDPGARRALVEHHLGLVAMLARRYRNRGLPLLDLIEEGNLGLLLAVGKFDPERGCRFSTYAKWWIRQSIELALMTQASVVRVPVYLTRAMQQRARPPRKPADLLLYDVRNQTNFAAAGAAEADTLMASLPAPEYEQPEWHLQLAGRQQQLERAMLHLKGVERLVLRARFGLHDDMTQTLQAIARQLNVSSERVRQIQAEALDKLRALLEPLMF